MHNLRILHISDIHAKVPNRKASVNDLNALEFDRVLNGFVTKLVEINLERAVDIICVTGDIAAHGKDTQYVCVQKFFESISKTLSLPFNKFFFVPGNHDIDRSIHHDSWLTTRKNVCSNPQVATDILYSSHKELGEVVQLLERSKGFRGWIEKYYPHQHEGHSERAPLGFYVKHELRDCPFSIHISGIDSSWLCGGDDDHQKILLTTKQIDNLTHTDNLPHKGFRLALVHHPLDWLIDAVACKHRLAGSADLILCGHNHNEESMLYCDPDHKVRVISAGALFENERSRNSFHVIDVTLNADGTPQSFDITFYGWQGNFWHLDNSIYRGANNGRLSWEVNGTTAGLASVKQTNGFQAEQLTEILRLVQKIDSQNQSDESGQFETEIDIAKNFIANRKPDLALAKLQEIEERHWNDLSEHEIFRVKANMGYAFLIKGEKVQGIQFLNAACQYRKDDDCSIAVAAHVAYLQNDLVTAKTMSHEAIARNSENAVAWAVNIQTNEFSSVEQIEKAVPEKLLTTPELTLAIAYRAFELEQYDEVEKYAKNVSIEKNQAPQLALVYARSTLAQELEKSGMHPPFTAIDRAKLFEALNRLNEREHEYSVNPSEMQQYYIIKSILLYLLGQHDDRENIIRAAYLKFPENSHIRSLYAILLKEHSESTKALDFLLDFPREKWDIRYKISILEVAYNSKIDQTKRKSVIEFIGSDDQEDLKKMKDKDFYHYFRLRSYMQSESSELQEEWQYLESSCNSLDFPKYIFLLIKAETRCLSNHLDDATELLNEIIELYRESLPDWFVYQLAKTLFDAKRFKCVFELLRGRVSENNTDPLTCLCIDSASRIEANAFLFDLIRKLKANGVTDQRILTLEINLYLKYDSYSQAVEIIDSALKNECYEETFKKFLRMQKSVIGITINRNDYIEKYPLLLPNYKELPLESMPQLMRALLRTNDPFEAQRCAYMMYRDNPGNIDACKAVIASTGTFERCEIPTEERVVCENDVAVRYFDENMQEERWHIIETLPDPKITLNEFSPDHPISKRLMGKKVDEQFEWQTQMSIPSTAIIREIIDKHIYRFRECLQEMYSKHSEQSFLYPMKIDPENVEQSSIFQMLIDRRDKCSELFAAYVEHKFFPITFLAKSFGVSIFEMALSVSSDCIEVPYRFSSGITESNFDFSGEFVLDATSIATAISLDLQDLVSRNIRSKYVSEKALNDIKSKQLSLQYNDAIARAYKDDSGEYHFYFNERPLEPDQISVMQKHFDWIIQDAIPFGGEKVAYLPPCPYNDIESLIPKDTLASIAYALMKNIPVWIDDRTIAIVARECWSEIIVVNTQEVLLEMLKQKRISTEVYETYLTEMLLRNFVFLTQSVQFICHVLEKSNWDINDKKTMAVLRYLSKGEIDPKALAPFTLEIILEILPGSEESVAQTALISSIFEALRNNENSQYIFSQFETYLYQPGIKDVEAYKHIKELFSAWKQTRGEKIILL